MEKELDQCYFADVAQFKELNEILRFDTRRDEVTDLDLLGQMKLMQNDRFQMTIVTEELDDVEFRFVPSTHRLLMIILEELCKHNRQELKISVDSYLDRCGLANKGELRKQLKIDLQCLKAIRFDIAVRKGKKIKDCYLCDIAELGPKGLIYVRLSEEVVTTWKKHLGFLQLPRLYFTLNRRQHRDAPMLLYYISLMRHISNNC